MAEDYTAIIIEHSINFVDMKETVKRNSVFFMER